MHEGDEAVTQESATGPGGLRVVLDARLSDGAAGGVQQWVIGLAKAFSSLEMNGDEYMFLVDPGRGDWLEPFASGPCRIATTAAPQHHPSIVRAIRSRLGQRLPETRARWRQFRVRWNERVTVPSSDGTVERLKADVVHFTFQEAFITAVPSLYQPWDLQHRHLPEFFSAQQRARRDVTYQAFCAQAATVLTATKWVKRDLVSQYRIHPDRIAVVNVPPATAAYPEATPEVIMAVRRRLNLPESFLFYPAQTWPHKNHERLFDALRRLRVDGLRIPVVCSGQRNERHAAVRRAARQAGIEDQVVFLGFVPPADVEALYRAARALVFPSLYEGWGLPILEAFRTGLPVACSNVTSLPELVADAALVFDPHDSGAIASAVRRIWTDEALATQLAQRGRLRVARFTWRETVLTLRAHYRRVAGRILSEEDRALIAREPLV